MELKPCQIGGVEGARCGTLQVFENRAAASGRKISLRVVVLPALAGQPAQDPVFLLAGGPGQSAVEAFILGRTKSPVVALLRRERDVVLVDQRGTGESNPLQCSIEGQGLAAVFDPAVSLDWVRNCRAELEKSADLTLYTTSVAVDDFDDVRAALGYDRINLLGGSYGSTVALDYLRRHPERVRSAVLRGVAPPEAKNPLPFARGIDASLERLFAACAADRMCRDSFPNSRSELTAVAERLDKEPVAFEFTNPSTRKSESLRMTRAGFADQVRMMLYATDTANLLPGLIHQAYLRKYAAFAAVTSQVTAQIGGALARGMSYSVLCAENVPFISEADVARETRGTFYGATRIEMLRQICSVWPRATVPAGYAQPVRSDQVAPPWLSEEAARALPNSRRVVVPGMAHVNLPPCVDDVSSDFIVRGGADGLDLSCLAQIQRPPFFRDVRMLAGLPPVQASSPEDAAPHEVWRGSLDLPQGALRLLLRTTHLGKAATTASLDSPDQGLVNFPVESLSLNDGAMRFAVKIIGATYEGKLSSDGSEVSGEWRQGPLTTPLRLLRDK
jgi:pimeloyl-ACP methyl ester carboxylesterase